jgi:hypothetical protein
MNRYNGEFKSIFTAPANLDDSRSIRRSAEQVYQRLEASVGFLNDDDLHTFLNTGVFFCPQKKDYYLNPELSVRLKSLLSSIVHKTGSIDTRVVSVLQNTFQEGIIITQKELYN